LNKIEFSDREVEVRQLSVAEVCDEFSPSYTGL